MTGLKESPGKAEFGDALSREQKKRSAALPQRIARYGGAKERSASMAEWLFRLSTEIEEREGEGPDVVSRDTRHRAHLLDECGDFLHFRHYHTVDEMRLHSACFCKQHLICPLCAIRRGSKQIGSYLAKYELLPDRLGRGFVPWMITLTVRNGNDLEERTNHLLESWKVLLNRRRDWLKRGRGQTEFRKLLGGVGAFEVTKGEETGWHPHIHCLGLATDAIDQEALSAEWREITGDSFIVDAREIDTSENPAKAFCEVFKYALKFSDLSCEDNWQAFQVLRGRRLLFPFGCMWGVKVPEELTDEPLENLPFVDLFFRYLPGSGYLPAPLPSG